MQLELSYQNLINEIKASANGVFLVSGKTFERADLHTKLDLEAISVKVTRFSEFSENPYFEEVVVGVKLFKESGADLIVAIGGGTAIDLAKLIKYYSDCNLEKETDDLPEVEKVNKAIKLVAVPTTFGTGSEATHFAVLYFKGKKKSIASNDLIPNMVLIDGEFSESLPVKVKASSTLDALCQAVESLWSKNRTNESVELAKDAIKSIVKNYETYISESNIEVNKQIAIAANLAGKAINITKTTAPHALSYTLTSNYDVPHGHAVALLIRKAFKIIEKNTIEINSELNPIMKQIYEALGVSSSDEARQLFISLMDIAGLESSFESLDLTYYDADQVARNVNIERLGNHPVALTREDLLEMATD